MLGSQYAALAKNVNGVNALIWFAESVVIDWRFSLDTSGEAKNVGRIDRAAARAKGRNIVSVVLILDWSPIALCLG